MRSPFMSNALWLAAHFAPKHVGPRRLGRTRGKMHLRRWTYEARYGSGGPNASAQSVGQPGDPRVSGESVPSRQAAPAVHFSS
jgi:hypothetical protein